MIDSEYKEKFRILFETADEYGVAPSSYEEAMKSHHQLCVALHDFFVGIVDTYKVPADFDEWWNLAMRK